MIRDSFQGGTEEGLKAAPWAPGAPEPAGSSASLHGMVGRSLAMQRLFVQMQRIAPHFPLISLEGEDGSGKTLAARTLHTMGSPSGAPFVPLQAAAFLSGPGEGVPPWPSQTLAQARGGTLLLDRLQDMQPAQYDRLLSFLEWLDHQRSTAAQLPARIIVSSARPLRRMAAESLLRADLAARLTAVCLRLPALRERREDIPLLAQAFIRRFSRTCGKTVRGLGPEALAPLLRHSWPGNVRELESVITAAALETESQWIRPIDLPSLQTPHPAAASPEGRSSAGTVPAKDELNLDLAIRRHIARVLDVTQGNKVRAAALLGISRSTLYRMLAAGEPLA